VDRREGSEFSDFCDCLPIGMRTSLNALRKSASYLITSSALSFFAESTEGACFVGREMRGDRESMGSRRTWTRRVTSGASSDDAGSRGGSAARRRYFPQVSLAVGTSEVRAGWGGVRGAVIAVGMTHLGAGAHREGGEDTGAPGAGAAGAKREARAARAQADGRGAAAHDEPRCG